MIADGVASLPVRMVFLADNNPGGQNCFAGGEVVERPCSTEEGQVPFADEEECRIMATTACATASEFVVRGSTEDSTTGRPNWFELSELKLFNEEGENVAPQARVELLFDGPDAADAPTVNDELMWGSGGSLLVWQNAHACACSSCLRLSHKSNRHCCLQFTARTWSS